jgi:hypothetical protein
MSLIDMYARQKYINMYLDYVNNFLTVEKFAEHYQITTEKAQTILSIGKSLNSQA